MNHSHGKSGQSHRKKKFHTRSLGVLGAVLLIAVGGVIAWSILESTNRTDKRGMSNGSQNKEVPVELVRLTEWGVALAAPEGVAKEDVTVAPIQSTKDSVAPSAYGLSTKASRDNAKLCGVEDNNLMILTRTMSSPSLSPGEFLAGTSKIGEHYYVYRFTTGAISEADCADEARATLSRETRLFERMVSNIQLN